MATQQLPAQFEAAMRHSATALTTALGKPVDLTKDPWAEIEKGVARVLGGPFTPSREDHQVIALGLSVALAQRLIASQEAFYFPYRDSPEGVALGFPQALVMLSPYASVVDGLANANLDKLTSVEKEIALALGKVKFSGAVTRPALTSEDYRRMFDASFVQLLSVDAAKLETLRSHTSTRLALELREAISRRPGVIPKELEAQIVSSFSSVDPSTPLLQQARAHPRLAELAVILFATETSTPPGGDEFWSDIVFPLLFIGAPATFPPLEDEQRRAVTAGVDVRYLFIDTVPYQTPSADEDGFLGAFAPDHIIPLTPDFDASSRLIALDANDIAPALAKFDAAQSASALERFQKFAGQTAKAASDSDVIFTTALRLITDCKAMATSPGRLFCARRMTEAEAATDAAFGELRKAVSGPRIILASS